MKRCTQCGMPMERPEDFAGGEVSAQVCVHCEQGPHQGPFDPAKLHQHIKEHLMQNHGLTPEEAEEAIRRWDREQGQGQDQG